MSSPARSRIHAPHPTAVLRGDDARVTPLELFFDLVFVLTLTQCTALMAERPDLDRASARRCWSSR